MFGLKKLLVFATVFSLIPSIGFAQSYYFERDVSTEYSVGMGRKKIKDVVNEKVFTDGQMMKIVEKESGITHIFRLDRKLAYEVDTRRKVYKETDFRALDLVQGQGDVQSTMSDPQRNLGMQAAREQLMKATSGVDNTQRGMMQQMMLRQQEMMLAQKKAQKVDAEEPVVLKWTKTTKQINGYPCTRFKIVRGKKRIFEGWVTKQTGPQNYYTDFIAAKGLFKSNLVNELKKIDGFPMRERYRIQTGQSVGALQTAKVTFLESRKMTPFEFEVPTEFTREGDQVSPAPFEEEEDDDW